MEKYYPALLPFLLLLLNTLSANAQYDRMRDPLSREEKDMVNRYHLKAVRFYSLKDMLLNYSEYRQDGKLLKSYSAGIYYYYTYDDAGNTIRMTDSTLIDTSAKMKTDTVPFSDSKKDNDTFLFSYDKNGFLKSARINFNYSVFIYDSASNTLVEQHKDTAWPEKIINTYTYNRNKEIIEQHIQEPWYGRVTTEKITYFPNDRISTDIVSVVTSDGDIDSTISEYLYNGHNKVVQETTRTISYTDGNRSDSRTVRQDFYDGLDRLLEEFVNEDGVEIQRYVLTYKGNGYEPASESYFNKGILQRVDTYELDPSSGLPLTMTEDENGVVSKYRYEYERW
jgi:YD repeat-containing protein